jgi:hypothetical protein
MCQYEIQYFVSYKSGNDMNLSVMGKELNNFFQRFQAQG